MIFVNLWIQINGIKKNRQPVGSLRKQKQLFCVASKQRFWLCGFVLHDWLQTCDGRNISYQLKVVFTSGYEISALGRLVFILIFCQICHLAEFISSLPFLYSQVWIWNNFCIIGYNLSKLNWEKITVLFPKIASIYFCKPLRTIKFCPEKPLKMIVASD